MVELLLSLLVSLTGIERTVDPELTSIAEQRAIEISSCSDELDLAGNPIPGDCWSHDGIRSDTYEVLAWNTHHTDEEATTRAVYQWQGSPDHWVILTNSSLNLIGCATTHAHGRYYFVCTLRAGTATTPVSSEPISTSSPSPSVATVQLLPNTRMDMNFTVGRILAVVALLLVVASFVVSEYPLVAVAVLLLAIAHLVE